MVFRIMDQRFEVGQFEELAKVIKQPNNQIDMHWATIGLRRLICHEQNTQIAHKVIQLNLIQILIHNMRQDIHPQLKYESTWIVSNLTAQDHYVCNHIVNYEGIQAFVYILRQKHPQIVDCALWGIGNLAADCVEYRDRLLKFGVIENIVDFADEIKNKLQLDECLSALINLMMGKPRPIYELIKDGLICLCNILQGYDFKDEIMSDILSAIQLNITKKHILQLTSKTNIVSTILKLTETFLQLNKQKLLTLSVRIIGILNSDSDIITLKFLNLKLTTFLIPLLQHPKYKIRKQIIWTISNIVVSSVKSLKYILSNEELLQPIQYQFDKDDNGIKRQICYIYFNLAQFTDIDQYSEIMVKYNVLPLLVQFINSTDEVKDLESGLMLLNIILKKSQLLKGDVNGAMKIWFIDIEGALARLQKITEHPNPSISDMSIQILSTYFKDSKLNLL